MQDKYIKLLLNKCLNIDNCKSLFISYNKLNKDFVDKVVSYVKNIGINDIYLNEIDSFYEHDLLLKIKSYEVENYDIFNSNIWDVYAKKNSAFLILVSEIPNLMNDVSDEVLTKVAYTRLSTKPLYREKQLKNVIPWTIALLPNEYWAKDLFKNDLNSLNSFWNVISDICKLNADNPIESWNYELEKMNLNVKKLNELNIRKLYYKNSLGTDISFELPDGCLWQSIAGGKWLSNMPSYEIFTTPDYRKTNGVVYNSKPLVYNGKIIDNFYLKFKDGKVIDYDAKVGKDILKEIINFDELSSYLGEIALVNYDSPISNTNMIFKSTLFDENASCHIAMGSGFASCIKNGDKYTKKELDNLGINLSNNHVDFMMGTSDLTITADTINGSKVIMENGNLII